MYTHIVVGNPSTHICNRVLLESLPVELFADIFFRIFSMIARRVPAHFEDIMPATLTGKQRLLEEIGHTITALGRLKGVDSAASLLAVEESFRKKYGTK